MRRFPLLVGLLALPLSAACKSEEDADSVSREDAPGVTASEGCQAFFECDCGEVLGFQPYETEAGCVAEFSELVDEYLAVGDAAGLNYNGKCIDDLRDALNTAQCDGSQQVLLEALSNQDLALALTGLDSCKLFYGDQGFNEACDRLAEDDPGLGDDCAEELVCSGGTCRDRGDVSKPQGEPCLQQDECEAGLVCAPIQSQDDGRCEQLPGAGETCLGIARLCDPETVCDVESNTCERLPEQGEPCAPTPNVITAMTCAPGFYCSGDTCDAAPDVGEPCPDNVCAVGAVCSAGSCVEDPPYACFLVSGLYGG